MESIVSRNQTSTKSQELLVANGSSSLQVRKNFADIKKSFLPIRKMTNLDAKLQLSVQVKQILELYGVLEISDKSLLETVRFIIDHYPTIDVRETRLAFDYAAAGKTDAEPIFYKSISSLQVWGSVLDAYMKQRNQLDYENKQNELRLRQSEQDAYIKSESFRQKVFDDICSHVKRFFSCNSKPNDMPLFWAQYFTIEIKMFPIFEPDDLQIVKQENLELEKISNGSIQEIKAWRNLPEETQQEKLKAKALIALEKKYLYEQLKSKFAE